MYILNGEICSTSTTKSTQEFNNDSFPLKFSNIHKEGRKENNREGRGDKLSNILKAFLFFKEGEVELGDGEYYNILGSLMTYLTMQINSAVYSFYEQVASSNGIRTMSQRTRIASYFWYWEAKHDYLVE
jgi:hypothetical protein